MTKVLDVCGPMKVADGIFEAQGCQSGNCGPQGSGCIIVADINNNIIDVGIRNNGKVKLYSENGKPLPQLTKWAGGR
ncbi:MAG: hypothetical protein KGL95_10480 [Patescibacteria group bacterium]|nr:hypothetical protein [Patescibacteria group bacterium]